MSGPAETVAIGLLEAGWSCAGVEFVVRGDTVTLLIRTPPIPISETADYARLIALATGKEH